MSAIKLNVSLDDELLSRLDAYADENYMSRSGAISLACTQMLNGAELMKLFREMTFAMQKISEKGDIDEEMLQQIKNFQVAMNVIVSSKMGGMP